MNQKEIAISAKRKMTISNKFHDKLEFANEICKVVDDFLVIKRKNL